MTGVSGTSAVGSLAAINLSAAGPPISAVDVVIPVCEVNDSLVAEVHAWLNQHDVFPIVHLVSDEGDSLDVPKKLQGIPDIRWHRSAPWEVSDGSLLKIGQMDPVTATMVAAHQITESFETPFMALGCPGVIPQPFHLSLATQWLVGGGNEWYAAAMQMGGRLYASARPSDLHWRRNVLAATAVIRRSLWVDLDGISNRSSDADVDFFDRANCQERPAAIRPTVVASRQYALPTEVEEDPRPQLRYAEKPPPFSLHQFGVGFKSEEPACDVVLPFRGQLPYVQQAIDSILAQKKVHVKLHLIDDATPGEIDGWLSKFLADDRVLIYRNQVNIGQFISFNNVVPHVQSNWIATQDGDDISLPDRLANAVRIGQLCQADLVAEATLLDGPEQMLQSRIHRSFTEDGRQQHFRYSLVPRPDYVSYFLENPTLIHRRDHFIRMGGFADFANLVRNRTSIDSEYMLRALHAGANIVATRRLSVIYRVHEESAIQKEDTKMGSPSRNWAQQELVRRIQLIRRGGIDPRTFGALGRHYEITKRWKG